MKEYFLLTRISSDNPQHANYVMADIRKTTHAISEDWKESVSVGDMVFDKDRKFHYHGEPATQDFKTLSVMYDRLLSNAKGFAERRWGLRRR